MCMDGDLDSARIHGPFHIEISNLVNEKYLRWFCKSVREQFNQMKRVLCKFRLQVDRVVELTPTARHEKCRFMNSENMASALIEVREVS